MERWQKIKSGFVSEKNEKLGLITLWITIPLWITFLLFWLLNNIFEYDLPLFSSTLLYFLAWLADHSYIGFPSLIVCLVFFGMTIYSTIIEPRKNRKWYGVVLIIGMIYVALDLLVLIIARFLNWSLVFKPFFGIQVFFAFLMLSSFILKFRIWRNERHRE